MREMAKRVGVASVVAVLLGGCAAIQREEAQQTESTLSAAGFQMKPADTPERLAHLQTMLKRFAGAGVNADALAAQLQKEGADAFVKSWNELLARIAEKCESLRKAG